MYMFMILSFTYFFISNILIILSNLISKKLKINLEKMSSFESGFNPKNMNRLPFNLRFFLITIIFIIFDVEIALILPMLMSITNSNMMNWLLMSIFFLMILLIGLIYEWKKGALNWL
uniref:NADH-ubiquinone oxidoreductase chain 3 n=1 Tax=Mayetiola destructor TaxID=39758 RepID=C7FIJ7_MAYDE|nr:NADH dehydrogenase subunit 3 [Mayetiola destructor]